MKKMYAVTDDVLVKAIDDEGIMLNLENEHVSLLNSTATFILDQIKEKEQSFEDLLNKLLAEFEIDEKNARQDLRFFLNDLMGKNIVCSR